MFPGLNTMLQKTNLPLACLVPPLLDPSPEKEQSPGNAELRGRNRPESPTHCHPFQPHPGASSQYNFTSEYNVVCAGLAPNYLTTSSRPQVPVRDAIGKRDDGFNTRCAIKSHNHTENHTTYRTGHQTYQRCHPTAHTPPGPPLLTHTPHPHHLTARPAPATPRSLRP